MRARPRRYMDELMAEPMRLPGCPQLIVTRDFAYRFLAELGYPIVGGFGSVDYMVFGRTVSTRAQERDPLTAADLTDLSEPWVGRVLDAMRATCGPRETAAVAREARS